MRTIAIIGGGFSGTMAAVNLARRADPSLRVAVVNAGRPPGRGAAYGTKRLEHLLNVAARNMSALPDHPSHFVDWLGSRAEYGDVPDRELREAFLPRRVYGDYLRGLLLSYLRPIDGAGRVRIELIDDEAVDVDIDGGRPAVVLARGDSIAADQVLLATGNQAPAPLRGPDGPFEHPRYCPNPWDDWEHQLPGPAEDIVLLGTGLTMIDTFLTLTALGRTGRITAVSRNGGLPGPHFRGVEYPDYVPPAPERLSLTDAVRLVTEHCRRLKELGQNPAIAVDKLRPHTQRLWRGFSAEEKRAFLREHAARWNVVRHRVAEAVHRQVTAALSEGRLQIVRGTIAGAAAEGDRVAVRVRDRAGRESEIEGAFVINCTGPHACFSATDVPLFRNLLRRGLVRPDELDMGIDVSEDFAAVDASGEPSDWLFAIGPLLKGTLWETTAVPELRGQAMRIAQILLDRDAESAIREEEVLEYCI